MHLTATAGIWVSMLLGGLLAQSLVYHRTVEKKIGLWLGILVMGLFGALLGVLIFAILYFTKIVL